MVFLCSLDVMLIRGVRKTMHYSILKKKLGKSDFSLSKVFLKKFDRGK